MANTIDSVLQLTETLNASFTAFKRSLVPLRALSTVYQNVPLHGTNKVAVPYYPLETAASQEFAGSYIALASATATQVREVEVNHRKVQVLSFTSAERARQPMFNPEILGRLKGEKLAFDVIADIMSVVKSATYTGASIAALAASAFDENDVAELAQLCMEANWPESSRSLVLNPAFWYALVKRPLIIQADQHGNTTGQTEGDIARLLGFDAYGTNGMPTNTGTAVAVTGTAATDLVNRTAHGLVAGDRVVFPTLTGGAGLTAGTTEYFVIASGLTADVFKVSATLGGAAVDITSDISAGTVRTWQNLAGFACLPSAILVAMAPIPPAPAVRAQMVDYQAITDESGLVLEYRMFGDPDTDTSYQTIECNYGYALGEAAALKIIKTA